MSVIKVVGIDPSLTNWAMVCAEINLKTGQPSVIDMSLIKTGPMTSKKQVRVTSDDLRRAREIHDGFKAFVNKHDAVIIMAELSTGGGDKKRGTRLITSFGVCTGILSSSPKPLIELSQLDVKLAGAGIKTATKRQMIDWAVDNHPEADWLTHKHKGQVMLNDDNEHLADALAAIYAGMKTAEFKAIMNMFQSIKTFPSASVVEPVN